MLKMKRILSMLLAFVFLAGCIPTLAEEAVPAVVEMIELPEEPEAAEILETVAEVPVPAEEPSPEAGVPVPAEEPSPEAEVFPEAEAGATTEPEVPAVSEEEILPEEPAEEVAEPSPMPEVEDTADAAPEVIPEEIPGTETIPEVIPEETVVPEEAAPMTLRASLPTPELIAGADWGFEAETQALLIPVAMKEDTFPIEWKFDSEAVEYRIQRAKLPKPDETAHLEDVGSYTENKAELPMALFADEVYILRITAVTADGRQASLLQRIRLVPMETQLRLNAYELTLGVGETFTLKAEGGENISFTSSKPKYASVNKNGKITAARAGKAVILVESENGLSAECAVTVIKAPTKVTLSAAKLSMGAGQTAQLSAKLNNGNESAVTFTSSSKKVATVDANGVITAIGKGTTTITATAYNKKRATCTVTVLAAPSEVRLNAESLILPAGMTAQLKASVNKNAAANYALVSSDESVASVDGSGNITTVKPGSAVITVTTYNGLTAQCAITVTPAPTVVFFSAESANLGVGEKLQLIAGNNQNCEAAYTYASANVKIATVDKNGLVTANKAGTTTITVSSYNGITASCEITVGKAPTKVTLSAKTLSMGVGQMEILTAELNSGSTGAISFTSSKPNVAAVDENGVITAVKAGKATITAKTYNGKKAACIVTVLAAPTQLSLAQTSASLLAGVSLELKPTVEKGSMANYICVSSDESVATVDNSGKVTTVNPGTATITVTTYNGLSAECEVTVTPAPTQLFVDATLDLGVGEKRSLEPTNDQGCEIEYSFASSNKKIVTVSKAGLITAMKAGTAEITVTSYNGLSAVCTVTVGKAPSNVTLSETALTLEEGATASISAAVNAGSFGAISFSSADNKIATVDENGLITAVKAGKVKITATAYNGVKASCTVTVIEPVLPLEATVTVNTVDCLAGTELIWTVNITGGYGKKSIRYEQILDGTLKKVNSSSTNQYTLIAHENGEYSMDVTVTDELGSSTTASSPVTNVKAVYTNVDARFKRVVKTWDDHSADELFNGSCSRYWSTDLKENTYVIWEMSDAVSVTGYTLVTRYAGMSDYYGRNPASWQLYGCNKLTDPDESYDGWVLLDSVKNDKKLEMDGIWGYAYDYTLSKKTSAYKYFMVKFTASQGSSTLHLSEFMLDFPGKTQTIYGVERNRTEYTEGAEYVPYEPGTAKDRITIPSLPASLGSGFTLTSSYVSATSTSRYVYEYDYIDSIYPLMHFLVKEMTNTGSYKLVEFKEEGDDCYWYIEYLGGGTVKPVDTINGKDYHIELFCSSSKDVFTWYTFVYVKLGAGIFYGDDYNNPPAKPFEDQNATVTVTNFANFLNGTWLQQAYKTDSGSCYYQYEYKYGDSVYEVVSMYVNSLVSTGLFRKVDFERYDLMCHWYLQYTGPGANELDTLGTQNGSAYHIKVDCGGLYFPAEYRYMYMTSIRLCNGIALGDTVWVKGMAPNSFSKPEAMAGFKIQKVSTTMLCPTCRGNGICHLCNGTGTYRLYGQAVSCSRTCSFCKGEKSYTRDRYYYVRA